MPDFTKENQLLLFLVFFVPGFVSLKVWDLLIPTGKRDFTKILGEVVGYSALNYGVVAPFALLFYTSYPIHRHPVRTMHWIAILLFAAMFILPVMWPLLGRWLLVHPWWFSRVVHPIQSPWDWVFMKRPECAVIVTLKSGKQVAGLYGGPQCFVSSYPAPEQIYLSKVARLDADGKFQDFVEASEGVIILNDIQAVEFFTVTHTTDSEGGNSVCRSQNLKDRLLRGFAKVLPVVRKKGSPELSEEPRDMDKLAEQ